MAELKACPGGCEVQAAGVDDVGEFGASVSCGSCGWRGPEEDNRQKAIEAEVRVKRLEAALRQASKALHYELRLIAGLQSLIHHSHYCQVLFPVSERERELEARIE